MNLNDLKENSVTIGSSNEAETSNGGFMPSLTQEEPLNVSMTTGEVKHNRVKADMSSLPTEKPVGIIDKVSPLKEIMEGGMFDEYRQKSLQEYSDMKEQVLENDEIDDQATEHKEQNKDDEFDFDEDDTEEYNTPDINNNEYEDNEKESEDIDDNSIEEDFDDDSDIEYNQSKENFDDEQDEEERLIALKSIISEKIAPIKKRLNLSSYTISNKVNTSAIIETEDVPKAKWVLMSSGVIVLMSQFSGSELESIRSYIEDTRNGEEDYRSVLNIIYNHIVSPKPKFKEWVKSISFFDFEHLFFAIYIASFNGVNYIPIECDSNRCPNKVRTYLTDNIPFMDMVDFKNDKIKNRFMDIYNSEVYDPAGLIISDIIPISDKIAIGFKLPSLYDTLIEPRYFSGEFLKKYNSTVNILPYIDNIYEINNESQTLIPYAYKIYANNQAKSIKSRVVRYNTILKGLLPDQYNLISGIIAEINNRKYKDYITYKIPETNCPYCGKTIEEKKNQSPIQMVFTRNRLGTLATM